MNKTQLITKLVRGTIHRAITESVPAVFLIFWVGNYLHKAPIASSRYYGCLLILASLGFIIGVVWSYALGYRLLHLHPESDSLHGASPFCCVQFLSGISPLRSQAVYSFAYRRSLEKPLTFCSIWRFLA